MQIKLNKANYIDKVHACWIGKNIGGTMGAPFEGNTDIQDIPGFTTPKGEPLPNDDLDLQLVWLCAMENTGPYTLDANTLGFYWMKNITAAWNEYGIGKSNLKLGLQPPLSGEFCNAVWKNSNGAWIRSEIWACLAPGFPNIALRYAVMDGCVDHGVSEGTIGEMFTAAMESIAFTESDLRTVIEKALAFIPAESRVARSVQLVLEEYGKRTPWSAVRNMLIEQNKDLGWFQAPSNIGFTVIGLLYGEGDFLQSLVYAINCGDDTDCTGATCGAVLGILGGTKSIPAGLQEYIGDRIVTLAIDTTTEDIPKSCSELTERVAQLMPTVLKANGVYAEYTAGADELDAQAAVAFTPRVSFGCTPGRPLYSLSPYSFEVKNHQLRATVEYAAAPQLRPGESITAKITFYNQKFDPCWLDISVFLPEGWTAQYAKNVYLQHRAHFDTTQGIASWEITLAAGETVQQINRLPVWVTASGYPTPLLIPLVILG